MVTKKNFYQAALISLCLIVALSYLLGCGSSSGGTTSNPMGTGQSNVLSGRILVSEITLPVVNAGERLSIKADELSGKKPVKDCEVWLENYPEIRDITDDSGFYSLGKVPPGSQRVVAKYPVGAGGPVLKMKCRSEELKVTDIPEVIKVPDMVIETARNIVTGQLRDTEGKFLPENTLMTLWGETFRVGKDGFFTSPPLPDSYSDAEILVQLPAGNGVTSFDAPFVSDVVPAFMDLTLGISPRSGNNAPSVILKAYSGAELVSKTNPGSILTMKAVGADADSIDQAALTATWNTTAGTFANSTSDFEKYWIAPEFIGLATVTVEVKDPKGATGSVSLPILVGINNPWQVDSGRPTVTLSTEITQATDSEPFLVRITFNEPVTGFAIEDVTVTNGSLSDLTTLTVSKVFTVKVTPLAAGEVKVTVPQNIANDAAGNKNTAGNTITVTNNLTVSAIAEMAAAAVTIVAPVLGIAPQTLAAVESATNNDDYSVTGLAWNEGFTAGGKFKAGQVYTATVTLTSKNSKKFQAAAFTPTVVGSASVGTTTTTGTGIGNTVTFTVTYATTGALAVSSIAVTTQPTKLSYAEVTDGTLALDGMVITETNNDGSTSAVTFTAGTAAGYTANPANGTALTNATHNATAVTVTHTASSQTAATSNLTVLRDYTSANIGTLKFVPAGSFQRDATPANISTVSTFRMSQHEITRAQFQAIIGTDPSDATTGSLGINTPVQTTNWYHAIAFCNKLNLKEGLTEVYGVSGIDFSTLAYAAIPKTSNATWNAATCDWGANGYRLPTEMEWMWAAMGATNDRSNGYSGTGANTTGYTKGYAGSTEVAGAQTRVELYAWYSSNSSNKTHPAGDKTANELGLYDMSGNVLEWCWDYYADYPVGSQSNYHNDGGSNRVIRGGSFYDRAGYVTVAYRGCDYPSNQYGSIGFRVVRP